MFCVCVDFLVHEGRKKRAGSMEKEGGWEGRERGRVEVDRGVCRLDALVSACCCFVVVMCG